VTSAPGGGHLDPSSAWQPARSGRRQRRAIRASARPRCASIGYLTAIDSAAPRTNRGAGAFLSLERWSIVEVATTLGLPLQALGAFDLGGGELEIGPDLVGFDLCNRPLVRKGLPSTLAESASRRCLERPLFCRPPR